MWTVFRKYLLLLTPLVVIPYIILYIKGFQYISTINNFNNQIENWTAFSDLEQNWGTINESAVVSATLPSFLNTTPKFTVLFLSPWHGHDPSKFLRIPECDDEFEILFDKAAIDRADAIVFGYAEFDHMKSDYLSLPQSTLRNLNVAFILSIQETEHHNHPMGPEQFDGVFNFIWMFRRDADIHHEFQAMYPKYQKPDEKWNYGTDFSHTFLRNKTKLAAWVVANCEIQPGNRNEFVKELTKHGIIIDVYGKCGNHSCDGDYKENNCFPRIGQEYKFYMALENSLCLDYITEKPAHGWENGMVPIIWGVGKKELAAPPGSYIDALEYETIEELAARIKYLDENPREYFKYFEWRRVYNTSLPYRNTYYCYAWRKIRELTMILRVNLAANATTALGHKNLEYWRAYFYNEKFKMYCKNCVEENVNVTHPNQNLFRLYNNPSKCKDKLD